MLAYQLQQILIALSAVYLRLSYAENVYIRPVEYEYFQSPSSFNIASASASGVVFASMRISAAAV